ncbi:MAG TPA: hypothetical protein PL041_12320 [Melioribacteraceae bacterium]|nr:hypothetical protein [Melioribacteraceae bacterium]
MAKPLFKNYFYNFDKNEKKILLTVCNQTIKQMQTDSKYVGEIKYYESMYEKISTDATNVKLTKAELDRLTSTLKANVEHWQKVIKSSWFIKRWLYKSILVQYKLILSKHFEK